MGRMSHFVTTSLFFFLFVEPTLTRSTRDDTTTTLNARSYGLCSIPKYRPPPSTSASPSITATIPSNISISVRRNDEEVDDQLPCICSEMVPRSTKFPPQTSVCPWSIYPMQEEILQHYSQIVTLGSMNASSTFLNYAVTAKSVDDGHIVGHFEYQWDAIPVCCYESGRNYSYEGRRLHPSNFLEEWKTLLAKRDFNTGPSDQEDF